MPPHDADWWQATGAMFEKLCNVLSIDSCKTPYILELYNGHRRRQTVQHFNFTHDALAHNARFRLSYCEYNALFQANLRTLKNDILSSHDLVIGTKLHTIALFTHAMYSFVIAHLINGSCQAYWNNL